MFVELLTDFLGQRAGTRVDVRESDAKALIDAQKARRVEGNPLQDVIAKAMASALEGITGGLTRAVDEALKQFANAQTLSRKNAVQRIFGEGNTGEPKRTFGAFLKAVRLKDHKALEEMGSAFVEWDDVEKKTAMSTQTGTTGGFLVPAEHYERIMALAVEQSVVRKRATVVPMSGRETDVPLLGAGYVMLVHSARRVRQQAERLLQGLGRIEALAGAVIGLAQALHRHCRVVRRHATPSTLDRLVALDPNFDQTQQAA